VSEACNSRKKVCIATSRYVGNICKEWASKNIPTGYELVDEINDASIVISVLYDTILTSSVMEGKKCYNFHPGILPEYRGAGAYSWTLINEDKKSGITLHLIDKGIDTGDIIEIREFIVSETDTAYSLNERGNVLIFKMFKDWFVDLLEENFVAVPQPSENAKTYYRNDLDRVKNLTKYIRALHFPGKESSYYINNKGKKTYINFIEE
tara:strand:+ start:535 stop:1158 length:624 start_codon:yes stop_codon:yes gene_type:complete